MDDDTMKKIALTLCAVSLAGCMTTGTDGVVEIGPNTYMVGGVGGAFDHSGSAVKAKFFKQASQYCADKGMTMVPLNSTGQDAAAFTWASAEVQFRCIPNK